MSLINDALKRAQRTTQSNEPPRLDRPGLGSIQPGQPSPQREGGAAKRIIWLVVLAVVACNLILWLVYRNHGSGTQVAARTAETGAVTPVTPQSKPASAVSEPAATASTTPPQAGQRNATETAAATMVDVPAPVPAVIGRPEFKLKTIVFHPVRPSAMINNQILFIGDTVNGYTVTAIGKQNVTLKSGQDELVLSLP